MNVIDIAVILFLLLGLFVGWKNGFTRQLISSVGFILSIVLAYFLKDVVASLFFKHMPFLSFNGLTSINIILYEFVAFAITLSVLVFLIKLLLKVSSLFEKLLNLTIVLGTPSHVLGSIVGAIEYFVLAFIIIFFFNLPVFNFGIVRDSGFVHKFFNKKNVLNTVCDDSLELYEKVNEVKEKAQKEPDKTQVNIEIFQLLRQYNMISKDDCEYLISHGKLENVDIEV